MKNRRIELELTPAGVDRAIKAVEEYQSWLNDRTKIFLNKLAELGYSIASVEFATAVYDGTNDWNISIEDKGDLYKAVIARGATVLFVEFGTGVTYPDNHPEAAQNGMVRGGYGKGHGKQSTWGYYGDNPGTNGWFAQKKDSTPKNPPVVLTHGNPANMPMYKAVKRMEQDFRSIAREVFGGA